MLEHIHIKIEVGLKRRAEKASEQLELRNLSAFIRREGQRHPRADTSPARACCE
jgi:hypothetical protein